MNKKILIVGGSGHGRVAEEILQENGYDVVGFLDDNLPISGKILGGIRDIKNICKSNSIDAIFIGHGCIINTNCSLGNFCILNTSCSLDHDSILDDYSSLAPKVVTGGNFSLGKFSAICIGSVIVHNISIGSSCVVGASSLVLSNISDNQLVYGSPSKFIKNRYFNDRYL